jgi:hypothetical protein
MHPDPRWWRQSRLASHGAAAEWRSHHFTLPYTRHRGSPPTWVLMSRLAGSPLNSLALSPFHRQSRTSTFVARRVALPPCRTSRRYPKSSVAATALATSWYALARWTRVWLSRPLFSVLFHRDSLQAVNFWSTVKINQTSTAYQGMRGHRGSCQFPSAKRWAFLFLVFLCVGPQRSNHTHDTNVPDQNLDRLLFSPYDFIWAKYIQGLMFYLGRKLISFG